MGHSRGVVGSLGRWNHKPIFHVERNDGQRTSWRRDRRGPRSIDVWNDGIPKNLQQVVCSEHWTCNRVQRCLTLYMRTEIDTHHQISTAQATFRRTRKQWGAMSLMVSPLPCPSRTAALRGHLSLVLSPAPTAVGFHIVDGWHLSYPVPCPYPFPSPDPGHDPYHGLVGEGRRAVACGMRTLARLASYLLLEKEDACLWQQM